ncbi:putative ribonucleotide transport ATP-binding protein mkl [Mycobacterium talmoniae]|nr:putative ribonucleotide transport ATP-binding protein mkl [Mycobacterium talmoniae]
MPERKAVGRRRARVREILHTLPKNAQAAIIDDLEGTHKFGVHEFPAAGDDEPPTGRIPTIQ